MFRAYAFPLFVTVLLRSATAAEWHHTERQRFSAAEANQGVAVDEKCFYAITNRAIGKYRKDTGERIAGWEGAKDGPIRHLNAGIVLDGRLYCAHSNFPEVSEQSSVEVWDCSTMQHVGRHCFERPPGSLTWLDRRNGHWFACFAHYRKTSDPSKSRVVEFDAQWGEVRRWSFPAALVERFAGNSSSGGSFGPGGMLFVTGLDAAELYVLDVPADGGELIWLGTVPVSAAGQAFAWDRGNEGIVYGIQRKSREVIVSHIGSGAEPAFQLLSDGKSFNGWEHKGNWVIDEGGAFYLKDKGGPLTHVAAKVPDDFELRFEWKVSKGCNSGVYYRPGQYEYQVLDNVNSPYGENPRQAAASLFFCMAPSKDASRSFGEWNEGRVMCKGTVIQHWLNGEKVMDFDYTDPRWKEQVGLLRIRGANLAALGGQLWLQDHGAPVWFRHVRMRAIPQEEKLERSDFTPLPIPPAALEKENARVRAMLEKAASNKR